MKFTRLLAIGTAAAALLAIPAAAQDAAPNARQQRMMADTTRAQAEQMAGAMFDRLDVNGDGRLDEADRTARQQARFDRMDTNSDGQLSFEEFTARPERAQRGEQRAERANWRGRRGGGMHMMRMAGAKADGPVTKADFVAAALARFDRMDANGDGTVTAEERRAARPQRANRQGGQPPATMQ